MYQLRQQKQNVYFSKMKKIFILTGEPSGDMLASKVIAQLKSSRSDIEYLSVGGEHLKALGIKSLYDLKEITYLGFTRVLLNIFKIKINCRYWNHRIAKCWKIFFFKKSYLS